MLIAVWFVLRGIFGRVEDLEQRIAELEAAASPEKESTP